MKRSYQIFGGVTAIMAHPWENECISLAVLSAALRGSISGHGGVFKEIFPG